MAGGNLGNAFQMALKGDIVSLKVKNGVHIYRGSLVAVDASGYVLPASDTAGQVFVGIAEEEADNSSGAAGAIEVKVRRRGLAILTKTGATAVTDVGLLVYADVAQGAAADQVVDLTGGVVNAVRVGRVLKRLPDTDGGSTYTLKLLLVDISPGA